MTLETALDVRVGDDAVEFAFAVTNAGIDPVELTFRSGLKADFTVRADGTERWRASDGQMFTQALQSETLAPGETRTYEGAWPDPEPGEYAVVAELNVIDGPVEDLATFAV